MDFLYFLAGGVTMLVVLYVSSMLMPNPNRSRLEVTFEGEVNEELENMRVLTEKTDKIKVICCALATYKTLQLAIKEGKKVALIDDVIDEIQEVQLP